MCYFHVVSCCKKNLRSHPAATQKMISDEVYFLHTSVSQVEFEARYAEVAIKWRRDFPEFARYFSAQWILGNFTNWKIYCSEPGIASTNNAYSYLKLIFFWFTQTQFGEILNITIINVEPATFFFPLLIQPQVGFLVTNKMKKSFVNSLRHSACTVLLIVH